VLAGYWEEETVVHMEDLWAEKLGNKKVELKVL
jgi:hypothetical protein